MHDNNKNNRPLYPQLDTKLVTKVEKRPVNQATLQAPLVDTLTVRFEVLTYIRLLHEGKWYQCRVRVGDSSDAIVTQYATPEQIADATIKVVTNAYQLFALSLERARAHTKVNPEEEDYFILDPDQTAEDVRFKQVLNW